MQINRDNHKTERTIMKYLEIFHFSNKVIKLSFFFNHQHTSISTSPSRHEVPSTEHA